MGSKMDIQEKLSLLAGAARYDASCASSGSGASGGRDTSSGGESQHKKALKAGKKSFGHSVPIGVCHSWTPDGRCVSLLKVLYSNACKYDCAYCVNRSSSDTKRTSFTVNELVELTTQFYKRNYIEGLFLSSGIFADPDIVMEKLIETARTLRQSGFGAYIHLKIIPGTGDRLIREAGLWADRLSANIELPTNKSLTALAPQKTGEQIFTSMQDTFNASRENEEDKRRLRTTPLFAPAGQSTQLIVGASPEDDRTIIHLSSALYRKYALRRVYYSAYIPVGINGQGIPDPRLPDISEELFPQGNQIISPRPLLVREHRLYQADWLLRFYHFKPDEILDFKTPYLDSSLDPKTAWALRNLGFFPVDIMRADYETLLRVPGIGAKTGRRIIEMRRSKSLGFDNLRRLGVILKRARYFITSSGAFIDRPEDPKRIRRMLSDIDGAGLQLPLFDF